MLGGGTKGAGAVISADTGKDAAAGAGAGPIAGAGSGAGAVAGGGTILICVGAGAGAGTGTTAGLAVPASNVHAGGTSGSRVWYKVTLREFTTFPVMRYVTL